MGTRYYMEPNGDYLSTDAPWFRENSGMIATRAACVEHNPLSINGCSADPGYLKRCRRVRSEDVPAVWMKGL